MTPKQSRFAAEYLIDQNATRAYRAAFGPGPTYRSCREEGRRLLKHPAVRDVIREGLNVLQHKTRITAERVLEEMACLAFANPVDAYRMVDGEMVAKPIDELPPMLQRCITGIKIKRRILKSTDAVVHQTEEVEYRFAPKGDALDKLMRYLNLYIEREPLEQFLARLPQALGDAIRQEITARLPHRAVGPAPVAPVDAATSGPGELLPAPHPPHADPGGILPD